MKQLLIGCGVLAAAILVSYGLLRTDRTSEVVVTVLDDQDAVVSTTETDASAPQVARAAAGYGHLTGQYILSGDVPAPDQLIKKGDASVKDPAVCAADNLFSEALVVDPKSKGIANIFVYTRKVDSIHPDLKSSKDPEVIFDQKGCRFLPHALFVRTDQSVRVLSDDPIAHNTHTNPLRNNPRNTAIKANDREGVLFPNPVAERLPLKVQCDFHPWMRAYWLVLDHPYATITDEDGKFTIENLPAGEHEFIVWQESAGYVNKKLTVTIKPGETLDIGTVKVPASKFQP